MKLVSPRQLARAAGVSESSIKRWCDQGRIPTIRTAGGHRRLTLDAAAEFLRQSPASAKPELLGLPARTGAGERTVRNLADDFYRALIAGDEESCRQIVFDLHFSGQPVSSICDQVLAEAFRCVGLGWECDEVQVYQERRGCGICLRILDELKAVTRPAKANAPLAIGGTPETDPYMLPTAMVEVVLRQLGWQSQSLGSRLPFATLTAAVRQARPAMFWLSVSHLEDEQRFLAEYRDFYEQVQSETAIVVGGRALTESLRRQMQYTAYCDNLQHLEALAKTLARSIGASKNQKSGTDSTKTKRRATKRRHE